MPRPRNPFPGMQAKFFLPEDLMAEVSLALYSPAEQRVPYGARSALVTQLLREWLAARKARLNPLNPENL